MATVLYRLGRGAFRWRWFVVALWVAALAAVGFGAATAPKTHDSGFSIPGTESQRASDLMQQRFDGAGASGAFARLVFIAPSGHTVTAAAEHAAVEQAVAEVSGGPQIASVIDPFKAGAVSQDGSTAYASVTYKVTDASDLTKATKTALTGAAQHGRDAGLTVEIGGNALAAQPAAGGATEAIGIAAAALILLITFGSLAAAGLPLLTAIIGVGLGSAGITALGSTFGLSESTGAIATMLGLAVGIDYAVFIVSRYREERAAGHAPREAAGLAVGTAGSSVVFAGLTVVIGLAGLSVIGIPMLTKMGSAAAATVAVSVLVALTLVPALLGFWPNAVLARGVRRGKLRAMKRVRTGRLNGGARWARGVLRLPIPVLVLAVVALGAVGLPVKSLHLGSQTDAAKPTSASERRAYDDLARAFGPGVNGPLTVVVDAHGAADPQTAVARIGQTVGHIPGVVSASVPQFNRAGDTAVFSVVPSSDPTDQRTTDLVHAIRAERPELASATGATFSVTGQTALDIDSASKVQGALVPYLGVVVGLAVLLLMVVFRSVLVPIKAAAGFVLSVLAALGAVVAVFQQGHLANLLGVHQGGPIMTLMPIFMVGIIFGLAMDYEVFIVSRIREAYVHGDQPRQAIVSGFRASSRVVVAAALIMTAVFSGFIGASDSLIKMVGFGMAAAVVFDAFVVRMALVPAVLALLGRRAWWMPRWLDRVLPKVDVDGEALASHAPSPAAAGNAEHAGEVADEVSRTSVTPY